MAKDDLHWWSAWLGNLHAIQGVSIYFFQNEMIKLLFLISFLPTMLEDALPLNTFHLNFFLSQKL